LDVAAAGWRVFKEVCVTEGSKRGVRWTRIVAEFLAIFAGITLSLLADDWRQGREDSAEERSLLVSLVADLRADSAELAGVLNWAERHSRGAVWLMLRMEDGPPIPEDSLQLRLREVTFSTNYDPVTATYVALKEGGRMSVLENSDLRDRIITYYERDQAARANLSATVRDELNRWRETFYGFFEVPVTDTTTVIELSRFRPVRPWNEFAEDPDARRQVLMVGVSGGVQSRSVQNLLSANTELVAEIESYLSSH